MPRALALAALAFSLAGCATTVPQEVAREIAPTGVLRAAINYGNTVLAQRDPASGQLSGVSVDLAREVSRRLGMPVRLVPFDTAGKVADSAGGNVWDIAFLAIDPQRAKDISYTAPYVLIEGGYMVHAASPLRAIADVDRKGTRVAVGNKSAYDLHLSRTLRQATIVRAPTSAAAIDLFVKDRLEVAAGVKQPLLAYASGNPAVRVLDGRFMAIEQAMGTPRGRERAAAWLADFIEEMKASGFVAAGLARSGQKDAAVAPPRGR